MLTKRYDHNQNFSEKIHKFWFYNVESRNRNFVKLKAGTGIEISVSSVGKIDWKNWYASALLSLLKILIMKTETEIFHSLLRKAIFRWSLAFHWIKYYPPLNVFMMCHWNNRYFRWRFEKHWMLGDPICRCNSEWHTFEAIVKFRCTIIKMLGKFGNFWIWHLTKGALQD